MVVGWVCHTNDAHIHTHTERHTDTQTQRHTDRHTHTHTASLLVFFDLMMLLMQQFFYNPFSTAGTPEGTYFIIVRPQHLS